MLQFIIDRLTPVFTGMGVSPEDVQTYVTQLGGYIYTIFGLLIALIVVLVGAHFFVKKGARLVVRWTAVTAWLAIVLVIVNAICLGPMYNNLAPIINGAASVSDEAKSFSDTALVVISRSGGEGQDEPQDMKAVIDGTYNTADRDADGHEIYIQIW